MKVLANLTSEIFRHQKQVRFGSSPVLPDRSTNRSTWIGAKAGWAGHPVSPARGWFWSVDHPESEDVDGESDQSNDKQIESTNL